MTKNVKEPLSRIEEIFAELGEGENFTELDLASAYNQLESTEDMKKLLVWSTHKGIYAFNRLPLQLNQLQQLFNELCEKFCKRNRILFR